MGLWEDIRKAKESISEDIDVYKSRSINDRKENPANYIGSRSTPEGYAWFKMMIPHLIGFVIGLAVARFFGCISVGYIIFGVIFAYLTGVYKSHEFDKISWKYSFIKNALLSLRWILMAVFVLILGFVMHKYGIK